MNHVCRSSHSETGRHGDQTLAGAGGGLEEYESLLGLYQESDRLFLMDSEWSVPVLGEVGLGALEVYLLFF